MNHKAIILTAALLIALCVPKALWGETKMDYSAKLNLQASTRPEARLGFIQDFRFPLLQGAGPLTEGNNLTGTVRAEVTPVSLNVLGTITFTPVAFFQLYAGGRAGSGWNMPLGNGIGINRRKGVHDAEIEGGAFDGLLWAGQAGATVQFDLAAVMPGDWHHLVIVAKTLLSG